MAKQIIGRVRPGKPVAYDNTLAYGPLDRVVINGVVYECTGVTVPGESPLITPDRWIVISPGFDKTQFDAALDYIEDTEQKAKDAALLAGAALPRSGGAMLGPVSNLTLAGVEALAYDASAASGRQVMDFAPEKVDGEVFIYVNADSAAASDTADLNSGRGRTKDMPFKTPMAAFDWANAHFTGGRVSIALLSDVEMSGNLNINPRIRSLGLTYDDEPKTIYTSGLTVGSGALYVGNNTFEALNGDTIPYFLASVSSMSPSMISIDRRTIFKGSVSDGVLYALRGGYICCFYFAANFEGSVITGPKYKCIAGSKIYGGSKLPGSEGICDSTSVCI